MYYQELLELVNKIGDSNAINKLDRYFAFLPNKSEAIITTSNIASKLELNYSIVDVVLKDIYDMGIIEKIYIVMCPECGRDVLESNQKDLMIKLKEFNYCIKCKNAIEITSRDIYVGYKLIQDPTMDSIDIANETEKLLGSSNYLEEYDVLEKLFKDNKENPHDFFYKPSIEERKLMKKFYENLDNDFKTTKEQGDSLEGLIKLLFNICVGMKPTTIIRTTTNQIDCAVRNDYSIPLTVYKELGSFFKAEGKNEPKTTPGNTYYHKLYGILSTSKSKNEQSVGMIFSRLPAASTCNDLARQYVLKDDIVIINICDTDLYRVVYEEVNFLDMIQEKIQHVKNNIITKPEKHMLYRKSGK